MLSSTGLEEPWSAFNCLEVEALAELFRHFGRDSAADRIVASHATGDKPGDLHYTAAAPATKQNPAVFAAIDAVAQAAGGTDANAYRAALRTATERGATAEQINEAYRAGRTNGRNHGLFDEQGRDLPW